MKTLHHLFIAFGFMVLVLQACTHQSSNKKNNNNVVNNVTRESSYGNMESRSMTGNCLSCHKSGGTGDGIYTVGGTVYKEDQTTKYPNIDIKFYTGPDGTGTLVKTLQVDGSGNFYTTKALDLTQGLYPAVDNKKGDVEYMNRVLTSGDCGSCHGNTEDVINIK